MIHGDDGIRSQPLLFDHASKWVNCPTPRVYIGSLDEPPETETHGVVTKYFESPRFGQWTRFRRRKTIRRNLVCWQREVQV